MGHIVVMNPPYKEGPSMLQHAEAGNAEGPLFFRDAPRSSNDTTRSGELAREFTPDQIKAAKRRILRYERWRSINGQAYRYAERLALQEAAGKRRVSGQWLVAQIRTKDIVNDEGKPCRPNNDYAPILVRELVAAHPEIKRYVERRTAIYDRLLAAGDAE